MIIRPFVDTDHAFVVDLIAVDWPYRLRETIPLFKSEYLPSAPRWTAADPGSDEPRASSGRTERHHAETQRRRESLPSLSLRLCVSA